MLPTSVFASLVAALQIGSDGLVPRGTRVNVFQQIYWVFLILGTVVGVVVIAYMCYNAWAYRDRDGRGEDDEYERPRLGEIPTGGGHGRKLFLSFGLSTIVVVSLIIWTYGTLLYVEESPPVGEDTLQIDVVGFQFGWEFTYPNGHTVDSTQGEALRIPKGVTVQLNVTSRDVFHNFGIPAFRVKTDAMPGHYTDSWFIADETGTYEAQCYELCGAGHSYMTANVTVMERAAFEEWYAGTGNESTGNESAGNGSAGNQSAMTEAQSAIAAESS